jgi:hypothetical protein
MLENKTAAVLPQSPYKISVVLFLVWLYTFSYSCLAYHTREPMFYYLDNLYSSSLFFPVLLNYRFSNLCCNSVLSSPSTQHYYICSNCMLQFKFLNASDSCAVFREFLFVFTESCSYSTICTLQVYIRWTNYISS